MSWYGDVWNYGKYAINPALALGQDTLNGGYKAVTGQDFSLGGLNSSAAADKTMAAAQGIQLPYAQQDRNYLAENLMQGSPYAQAAQVGASPYAGDQSALLGQLRSMAAGGGPSIAAQAYQNASQDSLAQQAAMAHGGNAMVARQAMLNQGRIQQGLANGLAQARTQEQLGAINQYGGAIGQAEQQDLARSGMNAQLQQQAGLANQNAYLDQLGKMLGLSQSQLQASIARAQLQAGAAQMPTNFDKLLQIGATVGPMLAGGAGGAAAAGGLARTAAGGTGFSNNYGNGGYQAMLNANGPQMQPAQPYQGGTVFNQVRRAPDQY